jgi:opacity protein-like surface antigen
MHRLFVAALLLLLTPVPAFADLTAFLGRTPTGTARPAKGFAIGAGFLIVGFEFEYSSTDEELEVLSGAEFLAPELKTYMFNGLLQTPIPIARTQFYGTLGGGLFHESLSTEPDGDETSFATNIGGGAKITLAGPLRLRLDYRIFSLRGTPRHTTVQRFYAGVNLKF